MKYLKLFEERLENEFLDIVERISNCDPSLNDEEYKLFCDNYFDQFFSKTIKSGNSFGKYQDVRFFYKEFFSNLRKKPNLIENRIFRNTLFDSESLFYEKKFRFKKDNYYGYFPSHSHSFFKCLKYISKDKIKYNFFDLGSGLPIKVLAASLFGYHSVGFEINKELIEISNQLGISDLVQDKSIYDIDFKSLSSPKIIYYFNPIYNPKEMAIFENEIIKNLNKGDIILRVVLSSVDKFIGFGERIIPDYKNYDSNSKLTKYLGTQPEIYKMKLLYHIEDLGPNFSIWIK